MFQKSGEMERASMFFRLTRLAESVLLRSKQQLLANIRRFLLQSTKLSLHGRMSANFICIGCLSLDAHQNYLNYMENLSSTANSMGTINQGQPNQSPRLPLPQVLRVSG